MSKTLLLRNFFVLILKNYDVVFYHNFYFCYDIFLCFFAKSVQELFYIGNIQEWFLRIKVPTDLFVNIVIILRLVKVNMNDIYLLVNISSYKILHLKSSTLKNLMCVIVENHISTHQHYIHIKKHVYLKIILWYFIQFINYLKGELIIPNPYNKLCFRTGICDNKFINYNNTYN